MLRTPDVASRSLGRRGWRSLVTGTALIVATVLPGFLTASLAPRIRTDFAFGDSSLGVAVGLFYAVSALGSVPAGRPVDPVGAGCGAWVGGVGNALGGPSVSALLKQEVAQRRQGVAFGAQQSGAPLGALGAGLALPLVAIPFGWRWAFVAASVLTVVAVACAPRRTTTAAGSSGT